MKRTAMGALAALGLVLLAGHAADAQDLEEKIAAARQAAAENKQALRAYSWLEKTEVLLKGEVKSTKLEAGQYGPDGAVQKTLLSEPPQGQEEESGRRRRRGGRLKEQIVEKKKGEMQEEMQAAAALVQRYLPPDPDRIQAAKAAGHITITPGSATTAVAIADYEKDGDSLVLTLDLAAKAISKVDVSTWLDDPSQEVTLDARMQSLPDGTRYAGTVLLSVPSSQVEVRITRSNYKKLVP